MDDVIVVVDPRVKGPWRVSELRRMGIPRKTVRDWQRIRWAMTAGLKKQAAQAVN